MLILHGRSDGLSAPIHGQKDHTAQDRREETPYRRQRLASNQRRRHDRNDECTSERSREPRRRDKEWNDRRRDVREHEQDVERGVTRPRIVIAKAVSSHLGERLPARQQHGRRRRDTSGEPTESSENASPTGIAFYSLKRQRYPQRPNYQRESKEDVDAESLQHGVRRRADRQPNNTFRRLLRAE